MRAGFSKRWLLPLGILVASAMAASGIVVFGPSSAGHVAGGCSGALSSDYACYQERYQSLVRDAGVEAAFVELKDEYEKNGFVRSNCHQLTHVIGRTTADIHGDLSGTYARGDPLCESGYYHGAMETFVTKIGADEIPTEADALCAGLRTRQGRSYHHLNCAHGLGHGFMGVLGNELFESLGACDALADAWERGHCYGGVFMENIMVEDNPGRGSEYLDPNRPLYPCTDVEARYKNACYQRQTAYALWTRDADFAGVFGLCAAVEEDFRWACYQGLGRDAAIQSIEDGISDAATINSTGKLCMLGEDHEARSNCVMGAVRYFVYHYGSDEQVGALCESFSTELRTVCLETAEARYKSLQPRLES